MFCPSFHLPSSEETLISKPTIAFSSLARYSAGASETRHGDPSPSSNFSVSLVMRPRSLDSSVKKLTGPLACIAM